MEEDNIDYKKLLVHFILLSFSILSNCSIFCFFKKEQSLYFSLLKIISLFEMSFLYSRFILSEKIQRIGKIDQLITKIKGSNIFRLLTFGFFNNFDFSIYNLFFCNSMKILYIILNIFLCIETINLIKRPFSQSKKKTKFYYAISGLLIIITIIIQKFIYSGEKINTIFQYSIYVIYGIFVISGITSIIFVIIRFCLHKPLIQSAKNVFVIRHFIYIIVLSGYGIYLLEFPFIDNNDDKKDIVIYSIGFVMFFIKISDQLCVKDKKSKRKKSKAGVTSLITSNLNVEFMCCILYGMTDIFIKNQK